MPVIDLFPELARLVKQARTEAAFKASFWAWLDEQAHEGPIAPMLHDFTHLWQRTHKAPSLVEAEGLVELISAQGFAGRAEAILDRYRDVTGLRPDNTVVLVAGIGAPEGYSRFDRGRNTIFIGLDHKENLKHIDHFEVILAHELSHAVRDPSPDVLKDYGGWPDMSHDDFVSRYAFREHLVSESLATAISEAAYGQKPAARYVYFDDAEWAWCEAHRPAIAARMRQALDTGESYRTFYREDVVAPGAPACCDYYLGFHLGRYALGHARPAELLRLPSGPFLERFLAPFLAEFTRDGAATPAVLTADAARSAARVTPCTAALRPPGGLEVRELCFLPRPTQALYRDLLVELASAPEATAASAVALERAVDASKLHYAGAPYEVFPFPVALSQEEVRSIAWTTRRLMRTVEKVVDLYVADPAVRAYFGFPASLEELVLLDPGYRRAVPVGRFDAFWDGSRLRLLELNTNGTAGIPLCEGLGRLYRELPQVRAILERHQVSAFPLRARLRDALLGAWREARGASAPAPSVAIVDFTNVPTAAEFYDLAADFSAHGLPTIVADPKDLSFERGRLLAQGRPIDLVYRRLTTLDFLQRSDALAPLERAYRERAVVVVGPFRSDVAHSKKLFAFLTDERWRDRFTLGERAVIDAHVPWTRSLRDERCLFRGELFEMPRLAVERQDQFILKPSQSFEGRGVLLGAETPPERWRAEVERNLGGTHVIQERVAAPVRTFVLPREGRVEAVPLHLQLGEYVFGGKLAGFQAWASAELVISYASTERAVPVLAVGEV